MKGLIFLLFTIGFFNTSSCLLQAQIAPVKQWDKTFGGNDLEGLTCLKQTTDGGYILGGSSNSFPNGIKTQPSQGGPDYWVIKVDANGNKQWDKTYGGNSTDFLFSLQQTSDGGYILGGQSSSGISGDKSQISNGGYDYWVVKLDSNGNKIWDKTYGGSLTDLLHSLQQTSDGGYVLGGFSISGISGDKSEASRGNFDCWVVKIDNNGNKIWDKTFGGTNADPLRTIQQTVDGGYILGSDSNSGINGDKSQPSKGSIDYWIVKIDPNGIKVWDKTIGGSQADNLRYIRQIPTGGYILGGFSDSGLSGDKSQTNKGSNNTSDYWIVKLDNSGNKIWDKTIGSDNDDILLNLGITSDGGFILGGSSKSGINSDKTQASIGDVDFWVVKLDSNGNRLWDKTLGGANRDELYSLQQTSDGGYILGGLSDSGIGFDKSQASFGLEDFWVIKLAPDVLGFKDPGTEFSISVLPNPNFGKFRLELSNFKSSEIELTITDLLGKSIAQKLLKVTDGKVLEELNVPAGKGIYLLQIKAEEKILSRKIVVE